MQEVYGTHWVNTKNTAVAMGYFDGIHIGHQFLINQMEEYAEKNKTIGLYDGLCDAWIFIWNFIL